MDVLVLQHLLALALSVAHQLAWMPAKFGRFVLLLPQGHFAALSEALTLANYQRVVS